MPRAVLTVVLAISSAVTLASRPQVSSIADFGHSWRVSAHPPQFASARAIALQIYDPDRIADPVEVRNVTRAFGDSKRYILVLDPKNADLVIVLIPSDQIHRRSLTNIFASVTAGTLEGLGSGAQMGTARCTGNATTYDDGRTYQLDQDCNVTVQQPAQSAQPRAQPSGSMTVMGGWLLVVNAKPWPPKDPSAILAMEESAARGDHPLASAAKKLGKEFGTSH